jgi:leucyl/phenylalanyl-tRNA--protein transferase
LTRKKRRPYWIPHQAPVDDFPPVCEALDHPDGLLAVGGDLSPERLIYAYRHGIFPWYSDDQPVLWWSPDPRMVVRPSEVKISRSLGKVLRNSGFKVTFNQCFSDVMRYCATIPRPDQDGTWITPEILTSYAQLHQLGYTHSVECWHQEKLVGGLYGVMVGRIFCGESMFARQSNASKIAFIHLAQHLEAEGCVLIDCQIYTEHLDSLGAYLVPRSEFIAALEAYRDQEIRFGNPRPF